MAKKYFIDDTTLEAMSKAIQAKKGDTTKRTATEMVTEVENYTKDATAYSSDMLSGTTAYARNTKITGTIPSNSGGTVTPKKDQQTVQVSGNYMTGNITVEGDGDLVPENIRKDTTIFGVTGNFTGGGADTPATATVNDIREGETAWVNGAKITGKVPTKTTANVSIDITSSDTKVLVKADKGIYDSNVSKEVMDKVSIPKPGISINDDTGLITAAVSSSVPGYYEGNGSSETKQLDTRAGASVLPEKDTKTLINKGEFATGDIKVLGENNFEPYNIKADVELWGITGSFTKGASATVKDIRSGKTAGVDGEIITGEVPTRGSDNVVVDLSNTVSNTNAVTVNVTAGITVDTESDPNNVLITATASSTASASATADATATASTSVDSGIYDTKVTKAPTKSATKTATDSDSDSDTATTTITKITADNVSFGTDGTVYIPDASYFDRYPNGQEKLPIAPPVQYSDLNTVREGYDGGIKVYPGLASGGEGWKKDNTDYVNIKDSNFTAGNIKYGTPIFDVEGTFTGDGNATENDILSGKSAYVKGEKIEGNIQSVDYPTFQYALNSMTTPEIPFTWDRYYYTNFSPAKPTVPTGTLGLVRTYPYPYQTVPTASDTGQPRLYVYVNAATPGWIDGTEKKLNVYDDNFYAYNIKSGVTMFGVTGTYTGDDPFSTILHATYSTSASGSVSGGILGAWIEDEYVAKYENYLPTDGMFKVKAVDTGRTRLVVRHYVSGTSGSTTLSYFTVTVTAL